MGSFDGSARVKLHDGRIDLAAEIEFGLDIAAVAVVDGTEGAIGACDVGVAGGDIWRGDMRHFAFAGDDAALSDFGHSPCAVAGQFDVLAGAQGAVRRQSGLRKRDFACGVPAALRIGDPAPAAALRKGQEEFLPRSAGSPCAIELNAAIDHKRFVVPAARGVQLKRAWNLDEIGHAADGNEIAVGAGDDEFAMTAHLGGGAGKAEGDGSSAGRAGGLAIEGRAHEARY